MTVRALSTIKEIQPSVWDTLWPDYPFTQFAFLSALEVSGATTRASGWQVSHLIYESKGKVLAAMPLYQKYNSWGEYVFDWSWADAYQRNKLEYYPKLLTAIPFTPTTGPRIGFDSTVDNQNKRDIIEAFFNYCLNTDTSSGWHILFPELTDIDLFNSEKLVRRLGYQFHWFNQSYKNFDEFLDTFSSRKRKNIRKERARVKQAGISIQLLEGDKVSSEDWHTFFVFYHTTYLKRSGRYGYLDKRFFELLAQTMGERMILARAEKDARPIAMALYFRDDKNLYGRYWGCEVDIDCLHFELCYYQGIEYAISNKLLRFDPGAQGEHKIQRGFTPVYTRSYHHLHNPMFQHAIEDFVTQEKRHLRDYMKVAREALPFKEGVTPVPESQLIHLL